MSQALALDVAAVKRCEKERTKCEVLRKTCRQWICSICSIHQRDPRVFQHLGFLGEEVIVLQSLGVVGAGKSIPQLTSIDNNGNLVPCFNFPAFFGVGTFILASTLDPPPWIP